ncbi:MAG: hypothetical protein L7F77_05890 [Candidatus Magnetominusculus sp. LBB02]|nr:hypothetical protein [Candidatus Magnetominusculus sp. LBB02]
MKRQSALFVLLTLMLIVSIGIMPTVSVFAEEDKSEHHGADAAADKEKEKEPVTLAGTAEPENLTVNLTLSAFNRYVFRGYEMNNRSAVFQPSLTISYKGFSLNSWNNIDTNERATQSFIPDNPGQASFNESDVKLSYTRTWGVFNLTGGYIYYGLQYAKQTQEIFAAAAFTVPANPVLTVYRDVATYPGTYLNLAFSQSVPLPLMKDMTLDLGACFGYMAGSSNYWHTFDANSGAYTGGKYSALHDGMLTIGVTIPVIEHLTVQPVAMYTFPLSGAANRLVNGTSYNPNGAVDQTFIYGLNMSYNF